MELNTFIQHLNLKVNKIDEFIFNTLKKSAADKVIERVKKRVIENGLDAKGNGFSVPYSQDWAKKRRKKGVPADIKNFSYTGSMWNSMKVIREEKTDVKVEIDIGMSGKNPDRRGNQELVNIHSHNEGRAIIELSEKEAKEITADLNMEIKRYLNAT